MCVDPTLTHTLTVTETLRLDGQSAAAELGQEVGQAEEDPHHQQVGAERQQRQRVQEAGVQPQVAHRQQAAQVLLDHPFPGPDASPGARGRGGGAAAGREVNEEKWNKVMDDEEGRVAARCEEAETNRWDAHMQAQR